MTTSDADIFKQTLAQAAATWSVPLTDEQLELMHRHYEAVLETNRAFNLTRITGPVEAAIKHYVDSLALWRWADDRVSRKLRCLDVGTGAGFPAIPLAIAVPNWHVTAIDSTRKKIDFVAKATNALQLNNLCTEHARSEHWTCDTLYDIVTMRAVSSAANGIVKAARHVDRGGSLVLFKSSTIEPAEIQEAASMAKQHQLRAVESFNYTLAYKNDILERVLLIYTKK